MSALRLAQPGHPTVLVDLGASRARGTVHDGARLAVPESASVAVARDTASMHRYRARLAQERAACRTCGRDIRRTPYGWGHERPERGWARHRAVPKDGGA